MPTDPQTGKRLPGKAGMYAGEPGAPADAPPAPEGGADMPAEIVPEQDIPAVADEADSLMLDDILGTVEGATGPEGDMPAEGEEGEMAEAGTDVTPIAEALGIDAASAQALYDASQQMPQLEGMPVEEIATMLADDVDLRMQVEKIAARAVDQAVEDEAMEPVGEAMPAEPAGGMGEEVV